MQRFLMLVLAPAFFVLACDADEVAKQCVAADLIGQCPVGSNPVLGAQASEGCGGSFDGDLVTVSGSVTGQCNAAGSCEFLCQFSVPCTCGVATITKDEIVCAECPDQTCGDSRCEGTERAACSPDQPGCFVCLEDCGGPSCGDGDCSGAESPDNCPQDCADVCQPNTRECLGSKARVCSADGSAWSEFDCATVSLVCGGGECVAPGVCGNLFCDVGETPTSCAIDCATGCTPNATRCAGNTLYTCSANGSDETATACAADGLVCANGACRPADVCGNQLCEAGEDATSCAADCAAECGNDICENGEDIACPGDCVVCGDDVCGANEITTCPQDCGICIPSEKQCLGKKLRVCNANGTAYDDVDCAAFELTCGGGDCVEADVCGNDLCDGSESPATCAVDCGSVCGDDDCDATETFQSCSSDCDPVCGDGTCEGLEDFTTCAFDCLASCGDGTCGDLEDRANCPSDCGFCGDTICQDGVETSSLNPPANLVTCVSDCVVVGCQQAGDCDDGVACTENRCVANKCVYTAQDDLCSGDDKCIKLNGCCPDADGDGYADEACGGSDCNDDDRTTHPGAVEVCGGGDKNCNGTHAPRLTPAKKLTNTASAKRHMKVIKVGSDWVVGWTGTPTNTSHLELVTISDELVAGTPHTVDAIEVDALGYVAMDYNPAKGALGVYWPHPRSQGGAYLTAQAGWVSLDGTVLAESADQPAQGAGFCSYDRTWLPVAHDAVTQGTEVIFPIDAINANPSLGGAPASFASYWLRLGTAGGLTQGWGNGLCSANPPPAARLVKLDGLVSGLESSYSGEAPFRGNIVTFDPNGSEFPSSVALDHPSQAGACTLGEDGDLLVLVCSYNGTTWYHRATQGGGAFFSEAVQTGNITPLGVGRTSDGQQVGVATRDEANNLWFFERNQDGTPLLAPAIIAGGNEIRSAYVVHDGLDFMVLWLAKTGGFEQVYGQRITCE